MAAVLETSVGVSGILILPNLHVLRPHAYTTLARLISTASMLIRYVPLRLEPEKVSPVTCGSICHI